VKPVVKNRIAIFYPQGFVDGANAPSFITVADTDYLLGLNNIDGALISLKKVVFFNKNGLSFLARILGKIKKEMKINIGFCDYNDRNYNSLVKMFQEEMDFCIFKDFNTANLFMGTSKVEPNSNILVWHEDPTQKNLMVIELYERGYNAIAASDFRDYTKKKKDNKDNYHAIVDRSFFGSFGKKIGSHRRGNIIIYTLSGYLDASAAEKFDLNYHINCLNVGFRFFVFEASRVLSINIHASNFFAKLSTAGAEYGATIAIAGLDWKKLPKFKEGLEDVGILFFNSLDDLFMDEDLQKEISTSMGALVVNKKAITKDIVKQLPTFIEAAVHTVKTLTNSVALKKSAEVSSFKLEDDGINLLASSIGFYGDIDGMLVLVFPENIAKKACSLLLGQDENKTTETELTDALGELVNIIGGRAKTLLSERDVKANITLPRTFTKLEDVKNTILEKKGVQIDLEFAGEPFSIFLTR